MKHKCPVCDWQDDTLQEKDPNYEGGSNEMSLNQAREACRKNAMESAA